MGDDDGFAAEILAGERLEDGREWWHDTGKDNIADGFHL
jgi:hypothetical protein